MADYPRQLVLAGHTEPLPRRIRAVLAGETVLDTVRASYVWEHPRYPRYAIPVDDLRAELLIDERRSERLPLGTARRYGLRVGKLARPSSVAVYTEGALAGTAQLDWSALDAWYEEDEQVFIHPRDPYTRVDALRSSRPIRIERDGVLLAESTASIMVFETGLPTRYYLDRTAVDFSHLRPSDTITGCPYKGLTSSYWSVRTLAGSYPDLAWSYDFPTRELLPIAGLIAFYNEQVDIVLAGRPVPRPSTHFFG